MATIDAIYKHHERTLTADLEADLQDREIGIDPVLKMLTASSAVLGAKLHAVTQESPTIGFTGVISMAQTLAVTGAISTAASVTVATSLTSGSLLNFTNSTGSVNWSVGIGGSGGGSYPNGSFAIRDTTTGATRLSINSAGVTLADALSIAGTSALVGVATFTVAPILSSTTASRLLATNGSKGAISVADLTTWVAGTGSQITSTSNGSGGITLSLPSAVTLPGSLTVTTTSVLTGAVSTAASLTIGTSLTSGSLLLFTNSTGSANYTVGVGGSAGGNFANGSFSIRDTTAGSTRLSISSAGLVSIDSISVGGLSGLVGVATFTAAPVFSSVTASQTLEVNGSKALVSVAQTGTGSYAKAISPTFTGTVSAAALTLSGNLTLSALSSGRIPVVSTAGLLIQDDLYWDATNNRVGIGPNASTPGASLHVCGANASTSEVIRLQSGQTAGAPGDYMIILGRHRSSTSSNVDGASLRWTAVNPETGTRTAKIGLYGSNNEVETLGLEVGPTGNTTCAAEIQGSASPMIVRATHVAGAMQLITTSGDILVRPNGTTRATFPEAGGLTIASGGLTLSSGNVNVTGTGTFSGLLTATSGIVVNSGGSTLNHYAAGSFTGTVTGTTATPTGDCYYTRAGNLVTLFCGSISYTSNSTSLTLTGLPAAIRPTWSTDSQVTCLVQDNDIVRHAIAKISSAGVMTFAVYNHTTGQYSETGFTNSGGKGTAPFCVSYSIQ